MGALSLCLLGAIYGLVELGLVVSVPTVGPKAGGSTPDDNTITLETLVWGDFYVNYGFAAPPNARSPNEGPPNARSPNEAPPNAAPPNAISPNEAPPNEAPPNAISRNEAPPNAAPPNAASPNAAVYSTLLVPLLHQLRSFFSVNTSTPAAMRALSLCLLGAIFGLVELGLVLSVPVVGPKVGGSTPDDALEAVRCLRTHAVVAGDVPFTIARTYRITAEKLQFLNPAMDIHDLESGQRLCVEANHYPNTTPGSDPEPSPTPEIPDNTITLETRLCGDFYVNYGFDPEPNLITIPAHCQQEEVRNSFKNYLKENKGLLGHRSRDAWRVNCANPHYCTLCKSVCPIRKRRICDENGSSRKRRAFRLTLIPSSLYSSVFLKTGDSVKLWQASGEIYSSMADLERMISAERAVLRVLQDARDREANKLKEARRYLADIRRTLDVAERLPEEPVSVKAETIFRHPINVFRFIKRHGGAEWKLLQTVLARNITHEISEAIDGIRQNEKFPGDEDITGIMESMHRLQATYKIHPADIVNGRIPGTRPTLPFTMQETFIAGQKHSEMKLYASAIAWLEIALAMMYRELDAADVEEKVVSTQILDWLQHSIWHHNGNLSRAMELSAEIQAADPDYPNVKENLKFFRESLGNVTAEERAVMHGPAEVYNIEAEFTGHYETLCRGELEIAHPVRRYQRCYLETYGNPFLLLQPVKTEVVHVNPDVFILHHVIQPSAMERVKKAGRDSLGRALVISNDTAGVLSKSRISKNAFLQEKLDAAVGTINILSGLVTNLDKDQAELLQLNNYGVGGLYLPHLDYLNDVHKSGTHLITPDLGDRIATFMVYLSDVEAGGATVFPHLNLTLYPEKGSAAFWYNLYRDGMGDDRTLHGLSGVVRQ
ncbi:Prolyl 4-hydroxylase subunit alpha-2 [Hypsibius exemplaris]|uniref:procollagen-proline 4-dioxygenase n=1 Tax=Hypsibius exemplaris TaxID=2072580 RepID=A0A9X6RKH4_HYPEX|nr:Prolyl 4-hydroxylase subunit alpha-2 [Hypsibius exemplaris]